MELIDPKRLQKLMVIQGVSGRQVSAAAAWKSHTYIQRLLKGDAKTLTPESAVRIAWYFGVGTDDLFVARSSSEARDVAKWERKIRRSAA
jgi:plasmid maintenance system antidote protein VapI